MLKPGFIVFLALLTLSCVTNKYLGTRQPNLAASACPVETEQCFMSADSLDSNGAKTSIRGSYFLESTGGNTYSFRGSVKLDHDIGVITNIEYLDLTFVFLNDDLVVHEEKVRLQGSIGTYLEFNELLKIDANIESSEWAWYRWRARE